jgi:ribonuclease BN (tRNA processing enzyme)
VLLTVLGCSGSVPGPNAPTSGYLLESEGFLLGIELGHGTLAALMAIRDPHDLDALLFSHLHPDHCADVAAMTVYRRYYPPAEPRGKLPIYAPSEAHSRFVAAYSPDAAERAAEDLTDIYEFRPLQTGTVHIGPFEVTAIPAVHPCESYSFRFSAGGRTLAYTGDTSTFDELAELAAGVDVLLSEASWTHADDRPPDLHLSGTEAGEVAKRAGVGKLLLTHVLPFTDNQAILAEARAAFPGEIVLVEQGSSYRI